MGLIHEQSREVAKRQLGTLAGHDKTQMIDAGSRARKRASRFDVHWMHPIRGMADYHHMSTWAAVAGLCSVVASASAQPPSTVADSAPAEMGEGAVDRVEVPAPQSREPVDNAIDSDAALEIGQASDPATESDDGLAALEPVPGDDPQLPPLPRNLVIATGAVGGASIGLAYVVGGTVVAGHRCSVRNNRPTPDNEYEYSSDPLPDDFLDCYPFGFLAGSVLATGGTIATVAISSVAGHRWAKHDIARGVRLSRKRSLGLLLGGLGVRIAGAGFIASIPWVSYSEECPGVSDGREQDQVRASVGCVAVRTFGGVTMAALGAGARWVGSGMMAYGAEHLRHERKLRLTPFVAPSRNAAVMGVSGRF